MASLKPTIIPSKELIDKRHKVRVALSHRGHTMYFSTDIILDSPKQLSSTGQIVGNPNSKYLNIRLQKLMVKYQEALDSIDFVNSLNCKEVFSLMKTYGSQLYHTLGTVFDEYLELNDVSEGTKRTYRIAFSSLSKLINPNILLNTLTPAMILTIDRKLKSRGLSQATIRNYMNFLRTIVNYAVKSGYVEYRVNPFNTYNVPKGVVRDVWLTPEDIKLIRDCNPFAASTRACRDLFLLSYYLGGINFADMVNVNLSGDTIKYVRQKVVCRCHAFVEFKIPEEAKPIIKTYTGRNGKLLPKIGKYKLNSDLFYHYLPALAQDAGLNKRLIFYSARKSFAQHAFNLGVDTTIIDYILGHSLNPSKDTLYHYITVSPAMATEAIHKVLENLK